MIQTQKANADHQQCDILEKLSMTRGSNATLSWWQRLVFLFVTLRFEVHFYVPCGQILLLALHFHLNSGLLTSKHTRAHKQPSGMFYL